MPKVKVHKARTDVYDRGVRIPDEKAKAGYRKDHSQPHPEGDTLFCAKGETYYAWGMMVGGRGVQKKSKTPPTRSQLTNSEFLGAMYDLEDGLSFDQVESPEDLEAVRDEIAGQLRDLGQEQTDKYDNMPDGLQQGDTGQLLEQRAEACENIASEFDDVDLVYSEPDDQELEDEIEDKDLTVEEVADRVEELKQEKLDEWLDEKKGELNDVGWDYE